jgi:hypothetical protein
MLTATDTDQPLGIILADGHAICPDCQTRINCGTVGIANLERRHRGTKICREKQERCDKEKKNKTNGLKLLAFFGKQPKATRIPPNVWPSAPVRGHNLPPSASPAVLVVPPSKATVHSSKTVVERLEPVVSNVLEKLSNLIENLPASIPEASDYDKLAVFAGNPAEYDNPSLSPDELWEETLNGLFKSALGWGSEGDMEEVIRRGRKGLDGLANFVKHFVVKRGVSMGLFEGKLAYLMSKLEEK